MDRVPKHELGVSAETVEIAEIGERRTNMAIRRKRRNRSTWFPILGFINNPEGNNFDSTWDFRPVTINANGDPNVFALPLIPDETRDPADQAFAGDYTLRDYVEGQTCIIDRVVGKVTWWTAQTIDQSPVDPWNTIICASGLAILPVGEDSATPEVASTEWDPLAATNADKPWLWRRTWVLGNNSARTDLKRDVLPPSNAAFGSVMDGPHLDTKGTKRAIRKNERLFIIHSVQGIASYVGESGASTPGQASICTDVRVLGHLTKSKNRSLFK